MANNSKVDKPTDEQVKEFWELCEARCLKCNHLITSKKTVMLRQSPGVIDLMDMCCCMKLELPIDLNNLFKYAVPKLDSMDLFYDYRQLTVEGSLGNYKLTQSDHTYTATTSLDVRGEIHASVENKEPALALFWAIYEVIK